MAHDHHHHESRGHHHAHTHAGEPLSPLSKLGKMVEHWVHHNEDHARSFSDWAQRARDLGQAEVAALLEEVAGQSLLQNDRLAKALSLLKLAAAE